MRGDLFSASGAPLTVELLRQLHDRHSEVEARLIVTKGGAMTLVLVADTGAD